MWYVAVSLALHLVVVLAPIDEELDLPLPMHDKTVTHEPREHEVMRARIAGFLGDAIYEGDPPEPPAVPSIRVCAKRTCWVGEGGLDEVVVQRYLKRAHAQLALCKREGMVDFIVVPDGTVMRARGAPCLVGVLRTIRFPSRGVSSRVSVWVGGP